MIKSGSFETDCRYAQCRGTDSVLRTLAHLLAAHPRATPANKRAICSQVDNEYFHQQGGILTAS
jgi:hypothetical protein